MGPLSTLCENMTSSTKPEVLYISYCTVDKRWQSHCTVTCTENLCFWDTSGQTDEQTNRRNDRSISPTYCCCKQKSSCSSACRGVASPVCLAMGAIAVLESEFVTRDLVAWKWLSSDLTKCDCGAEHWPWLEYRQNNIKHGVAISDSTNQTLYRDVFLLGLQAVISCVLQCGHSGERISVRERNDANNTVDEYFALKFTRNFKEEITKFSDALLRARLHYGAATGNRLPTTRIHGTENLHAIILESHWWNIHGLQETKI